MPGVSASLIEVKAVGREDTKRWYDYLWLFSLLYLILGFSIFVAWLGLICFVTPLLDSAIREARPTATGIAEEGSFSVS